jgi:aldose 1-epimerase
MNLNRRRAFVAVLGLGVSACTAPPKEEAKKEGPPKVKKQPFGTTADGQAVELYTLTNAKGAEAAIMNYGATIVSVKVPDRAGAMADVVLGFDSYDPYPNQTAYFGATIGRYANRIGGARFKLNGVEYKLAKNDGPNTLHGGLKGFDKRMWTVKEAPGDVPALELSYLSKDGEENFPGNLQTTVTYKWNDSNELQMDYKATTDKDTVLNLTNHAYFNLAGHGEGDILSHELMIDADKLTPVNATLIPTGKIEKVDGTPFDFRKPTPIGQRIGDNDQQLKFGKGYDHNFVLNHVAATPTLAARVRDPKSGRVLEVLTTEPGIQFYTGNFLDGTLHGKGGKVYARRSAFTLETQHYPDSPNKPNFPSTTLKANSTYTSTTIYRFTL